MSIKYIILLTGFIAAHQSIASEDKHEDKKHSRVPRLPSSSTSVLDQAGIAFNSDWGILIRQVESLPDTTQQEQAYDELVRKFKQLADTQTEDKGRALYFEKAGCAQYKRAEYYQ